MNEKGSELNRSYLKQSDWERHLSASVRLIAPMTLYNRPEGLSTVLLAGGRRTIIEGILRGTCLIRWTKGIGY